MCREGFSYGVCVCKDIMHVSIEFLFLNAFQ